MQRGSADVARGVGGVFFRRFIAFLAVSLSLIAVVGPAEARRYASIVIDAETGVVLHEANADTRAYPASLTKMMTLYLLFEALDKGVVAMDQNLTASKRAAGQPATNLALRPGDKISVDLAIRALVIRSANDVATVVAEALGGTESKFAQRMTEKARQLGMANTTFRNASGLPNEHQMSTARDLARLATALMRDFPQHYHYFSTEAFTYKGKTYRTHNRLMTSYAGADGLKTGYIRASGFNLATSAMRNGHRLIAIVLGGKTARSRDDHMATLLNRSFAKIETGNVQVATASVMPSMRSKDSLVIPAPKPPAPESMLATAVSALVPAAQAAVPDEPMAGPWGVQVGAFAKFAPAQTAATKAAKDARALLQDARIVVDERNKKGKRTLYRARIIGLTEKDARAACRFLETKKNTPCLVVRIETTMAMSNSQ